MNIFTILLTHLDFAMTLGRVWGVSVRLVDKLRGTGISGKVTGLRVEGHWGLVLQEP